MGLGALPDSKLTGDLGVFANQDDEKELVVVAVEQLVTTALLSAADATSMMNGLLDETKFYGAFSELATYGWLLRHSLHFEPQVEFKHPEIVNPNKSHLDGVLTPYNTAFDIKSFGLGSYLAALFKAKLVAKAPLLRVKLSGRMDVDPKTVEKDAFGKLSEIEADLRTGKTVRIRSLSWTITPIVGRPAVVISETSTNPYKLALELKYYPFSDASQFTTKIPFMLIFSYLPRFNQFLRDDPAGLTQKFFRSLARRAFIELAADTQMAYKYDRRKGMKRSTATVGNASRLLSAILFVDLQTEGYHAFFNPRATNPIPQGIESFTMNSHPVTALRSHDDFKYDDY